MRLVLASGSPRRCDLLRAAGLEFEIIPSGVDEIVPAGTSPELAAVELAKRKALHVARSVAKSRAEHLVLGADTVVALASASGYRLLGKPEDAAAAAHMLQILSGTRHEVITGVCAVRVSDLCCQSDFERTLVSMRAISALEIEHYVASGEWRDKAGGYGIQAGADRFVTQLAEGGFDNVVGLPVARTLRLLGRLGFPGTLQGP